MNDIGHAFTLQLQLDSVSSLKQFRLLTRRDYLYETL